MRIFLVKIHARKKAGSGEGDEGEREKESESRGADIGPHHLPPPPPHTRQVRHSAAMGPSMCDLLNIYVLEDKASGLQIEVPPIHLDSRREQAVGCTGRRQKGKTCLPVQVIMCVCGEGGMARMQALRFCQQGLRFLNIDGSDDKGRRRQGSR